MSEGEIKSIEELRRAQAAANANGASIPNYNEWENILSQFEEVGIESTGSYEGDMRLYSNIVAQAQQLIEQVQQQRSEEQIKPENIVNNQTDNNTRQDREQVVKANIANGTSSTIMSDYMKYYFNL